MYKYWEVSEIAMMDVVHNVSQLHNRAVEPIVMARIKGTIFQVVVD